MAKDESFGATLGGGESWRRRTWGGASWPMRPIGSSGRVLDICAENGHSEVRYSHINFTAPSPPSWGAAPVPKKAMGKIVEQCEQLGLVERVRDKRDARAKIVRFTELGLQWLSAFRIALYRAEQEMRDESGFLRTDAIASALEAYGQAFDQLGSQGTNGAASDDG